MHKKSENEHLQLQCLAETIERIFHSRGRIRIIVTLLQQREINLSRLLNQTKLSYNALNMHLNSLKAEGLVTEKRYGRIRIIRLNLDKEECEKALEYLSKLALIFSLKTRQRSP